LVYQDLGKPIIAYEAAAVYRLLWLVLWEATLLAVSLLLKQQKQEWQYWQIHYQKAAQVPMFYPQVAQFFSMSSWSNQVLLPYYCPLC